MGLYRASIVGLGMMVLSGCVSGPMRVAQISRDQSVSQAIATPPVAGQYEKGPKAEGRSCATALFGLIPLTARANEKTAVRAALESVPGKWTTLLDADLSMTQYPYVLARTLCWEAVGTAARKTSRHAQGR